MAWTSVASITTAAGLAKRVFYDHFADKEACFVELFREFGAERLRAALNTAEAASDPSAFGIVRSVIRSLVTHRASDPRLVAAIEEARHPDAETIGLRPGVGIWFRMESDIWDRPEGV